MAKEPFLINPPRRVRESKSARRHMAYVRSFRSNPDYSPAGGFRSRSVVGVVDDEKPRKRRKRRVKMAKRKTKTKVASHKTARRKKKRASSRKGRRRIVAIIRPGRKVRVKRRKRGLALIANPRRRHRRRRNPAPLIVTGANPARRRRRHRRNRVHSRRRRSFRMNAPRRRFRRNVRHYRRHRRNPASAGILGPIGLNVKTLMNILPLAITGGVGLGVTQMAPGLVAPYIGNSTAAKYASQTAVVLGGGMLVTKFVGRKHGVAWVIGASAGVLWDVIHTYVLQGMLGMSGYQLSGYNLSDSYYPGGTQVPVGEMMSAYPDVSHDMSGMGAFPDTYLNY